MGGSGRPPTPPTLGAPRRSRGASRSPVFFIIGSAREGVLDAAVDRERAAGRLGLAVRGQEQDSLGDVLGQDAGPQQVALAVEVLELLDGDALGGRPLAADLRRP